MRYVKREVVVMRWTPASAKDAAIERVTAGEAVSRGAHDVGVEPDTVYGLFRF